MEQNNQQPIQPQQPLQPQPTVYAPRQTTPSSPQQPSLQTVPTSQPLQPFSGSAVPPQHKNRMSVLLVTALILVLAGGAAGLLLLTNKKEDTKSPTTNNTKTEEKKQEEIPTTETNSELKTDSASSKARDVNTRSKINAIHAKLEEYYNNNNAYPQTIDTASDTTFPNIDLANLKDTNGKPLQVKIVADAKAAQAVAPPTADARLLYIAYGCKTGECTKYILHGYIENVDGSSTVGNIFTKNSLN